MTTSYILVVEDNRDMAKLVELHFTNEGWQVDLAFDGKAGLRKARSGRYNLIILDVMLPHMDGMDLLKTLRTDKVQTPVILLTSRSSEIDRVLGLELGADDYVTKPFSIRELVARAKALFRRIDTIKHQDMDQDLTDILVKELRLIPEKRRVLKKDKIVELTAKEYDLLYHFAKHPGKVFSRSQLLDLVWGYGHDGYGHVVNSNINRLRSKIESDPAHPEYILTVWGIGYKFRDEG
ncbi:MAG: response regulator transcription factor [Desulfobacterales bacterium]|nr:response regulator transcription factor [Desulfobacterales bacterium]